MRIDIRYFGMAAEAVGKRGESFEFESSVNVGKLKKALQCAYYKLDRMEFQIAVNMEVVLDGDELLNDGDEVALLPAFAGG